MTLRSALGWILALLVPAAAPSRTEAPPPSPSSDDIRRKNVAVADMLRSLSTRLRGRQQRDARAPQFVLQMPMPGVVPPGQPIMAQDERIRAHVKWASDAMGAIAPGGASMLSYAWGSASYLAMYNGYTFLGYPFLAQLSQVVEFRKPCEIFAEEMTREWMTITSRSDDDDKQEKVRAIEDELDRIGAREAFRKAYETDAMFGIAMIAIRIKDFEGDLLKTPLVEGNVERDSLLGLRCIEPIWQYPGQYNAVDPLAEDFYRPTTWWILSTEIHASRMLSFVGRPVPDILKPVYLFGGLSLQQIIEPYVRNWLETRASVNRTLLSFSTMVLKLQLDTYMQPGGAEALDERVNLFNQYRDSSGAFVADFAREAVENVAVPLGSLDKLQAQAQEHQSSAASIPLVKMFGITPSGLNATTEGEERTFDDTIRAKQERLGTPNMRRLIDVVQMSLFGEIDDDIVYFWNPLRNMSAKEKAELNKSEADRDVAYVDGGILHPKEVRKRLADDEESGYHGLDADDVPDLLEEEAEGLEPQDGRPQQAEAEQAETGELAEEPAE